VTAILVVDDDKTIRVLLQRIAQRAGFEVDCAKDGIEALEKLAERNYDIAIVDLMMPRMSGYDLVQQISTMQPRPTVLVATAMMNGDAATLDDSMVRRVIRKPFDINAVATALIETARQVAEEKSTPAPQVVVVDNAQVERLASSKDEPPPADLPPSKDPAA
jgi:DNA-binding response OmpR family regulator